MKIYAKLDSTESEKKIIEALNEQDNHIKLISRQYGEALGKINKLEQKITLLEKWKNQQILRSQNEY